MNLSISNIGWGEKDDDRVYGMIKRKGFSGLEIAPTRVFPAHPYDDLDAARKWSRNLLQENGLVLSSMQSIWYGRSEKILGSEEEYVFLKDYAKKAMDFAEAVGCSNLVFGCPGNRTIPDGRMADEAIPFFREIGEYAISRHCVIAMEANPAIYNTNFLNSTEEAIAFVEKVHSNGVLLNLDVGTMVENDESVSLLEGFGSYIHHVHISEPWLKPILKRKLHTELAQFLYDTDYNGFVSIEVGRQEGIESLSEMMDYVKSVFCF